MYGDLFPDEFYKPYDPFTLYKWKSESSVKSEGEWTDYDPTLGASDEILTNLCDALLHTAQVMQELYED